LLNGDEWVINLKLKPTISIALNKHSISTIVWLLRKNPKVIKKASLKLILAALEISEERYKS